MHLGVWGLQHCVAYGVSLLNVLRRFDGRPLVRWSYWVGGTRTMRGGVLCVAFIALIIALST